MEQGSLVTAEADDLPQSRVLVRAGGDGDDRRAWRFYDVRHGVSKQPNDQLTGLHYHH